jgi:hypothetical protein
VILRCTKKLFDVIRPKSLEPPVIPLSNDDWYADLLWYDKCKCLLLTHRETLFTAFEPDLNLAQLRGTHRLVNLMIRRELTSAGLPADTFALEEPSDDEWDEHLALTKTRRDDRDVLFRMKNMAAVCDQAVMGAGGLLWIDLPELNRQLRQNVTSARARQPPQAWELDEDGDYLPF